MNEIKVIFFMIVTDPDIIIADYAIKSYEKIKHLSFKLYIYSNWISSELKREYFPRWRKFNFVEIEENNWQSDECKPRDPKLEGLYEKGATIWDRELKKLDAPYIATVDADFEILEAKFIYAMLSELDSNSNLIAMGTDRQNKVSNFYESYKDRVICLNERLQTWFCIYKKEAFECNVSHFYYENITSDSPYPIVWDDAGFFQKKLKSDYGYSLATLDSKYQPCFLHYGAFSKNRDINKNNISLYRKVCILGKKGLFGKKGLLIDRIIRYATVNWLIKLLFGTLDRSKFWNKISEN